MLRWNEIKCSRAMASTCGGVRFFTAVPICFLLVLSALDGPSLAAQESNCGAESSGIKTASVPGLSGIDVSPWHAELAYEAGLAGSGIEFHTIADAVFLADGTLVVADQGDSQLVFIDTDGDLQSRFGRAGEGPGDFRRLERVGLTPGGRLFAYDGPQQRITFFREDGEFDVRRFDLSPGYNPELPLVFLENGDLLAVSEPSAGYQSDLGPHRTSVELLLVNPTGEVIETIERRPGKDFYMTAEVGRIAIGFARTTLYAGRGPYVVLGTTDALEITLYAEGQPVLELCGDHTPDPVSDDDAANWPIAVVAEVPMPEEYRAMWVGLHEQAGVRESYPAFGALQVDAAGRIWVGESTRLQQQTRRWVVFSPDGRPIGRLDLPVYRPVPLEMENAVVGHPTHELLDVMGDRIAILRTDEAGDQFIEVRRIDQQ